MRVSPLAITIILAILTGVLAIAIWVLIAGHFNAAGTLAQINDPTITSLAYF